MTDTRRVPLVLISGLCPGPNAAVAELLRGADPGTAVVQHDLRAVGQGVVRRRLRLGARDESTVLELAHGCVSCTLREDLLPLVRRLSGMAGVRRIVLALDPAMEPEPVCWALANVLVGDRPVLDDVQIEAVLAVLDQRTWLAAATGTELLAERGLHASAEDERTLAQVALSQVEFADLILLSGNGSDPWATAKTTAVLDRVAPAARRHELAATDVGRQLLDSVPPLARRGTVTDMHGALLLGQPPLQADCGIATLLFNARRPFHPERLHEAIDVLLDGVVRTRGRVWVASQPDIALWIESAGGGLGIGHAGPWLAAAHGPGWDAVSAERSALASLRWDPDFGDRAQELVVVTHQATPEEVESALRGALLSDDELAAGARTWLTYPDPFGEWHEEPCADTAIPADRQDAALGRRQTTREEEL